MTEYHEEYCSQENLHKIKKEEHSILQVNVASKKLSIDTLSQMKECPFLLLAPIMYKVTKWQQRVLELLL